MKNTAISKAASALLIAILLIAQTIGAVTSSYYSTINNTSGSTLWNAVHTVAKTGYSTSVSYNTVWTVYATTDSYMDGSTKKIYDMYGGCDFTYGPSKDGGDQCGNYSNECDCYNREHSIPKSWFGGSESANTPGSDVFHLVPTDGKINNTRSNYAFGEVATASKNHNTNGLVNKLGTAKSITIENTMMGASATKSCSSSPVFEPDDIYKGDFARGYFGTLLKWAGDYQAFTTDDGAAMFSGTYTEAGKWGLTEYGIALLLKWHRQDPVSQKEIDRNNGIQQTQGNRNPFIDYPILAEYIWGKYAGQIFSLDNAVGSFDTNNFTPGISDGDKNGSGGGGGGDTQYTVTWMVNGSQASSGQVNSGSKPTLPNNPSDCSEDRVFMGWTASSNVDSDPDDLFTDQNGAPYITDDKTFYSVYADSHTSGGGSTTKSMTAFTSISGNVDDDTNVSYEAAQGTAQNAPAINSNQIRIYQNGGLLTITANNDKKLTSITIGSAMSTTVTYAVDGGSTSANQSITAGGTFTLNNIDATSVVFTCTGTNKDSRLYLNSLSVTYSGGGGSTTTYDNYSLYCTDMPEVTVTFLNSGAEYAVRSGISGQPMDAVDDPTACDGYTFEGWSTNQYAADNTATPLLDDIPTTVPAADITYYAVYSHTESSGSGSGEFAFVPADFSGQGVQGSGSAMSATKNGVTLSFNKGYGTTQIRSYAGGTFTFSADYAISEISITTNYAKGDAENIALTDGGGSYTGNGTTGTWTGSSTAVTFANADKQVQITGISGTVGGGSSVTYYTTAPCTTPTPTEEVNEAMQVRKFIRDGRIIILRNNTEYGIDGKRL